MDRRLLLSASAEHVEFINVGIVTITKGYRTMLQTRRRLWQDVHNQTVDLYEFTFWDASCDFHLCDLDAMLSTEQLALLEKQGWLELGDTKLVGEDPDAPDVLPARTECNVCSVTGDHVIWRAVPKHTDLQIETSMLTWEDLLGDDR